MNVFEFKINKIMINDTEAQWLREARAGDAAEEERLQTNRHLSEFDDAVKILMYLWNINNANKQRYLLRGRFPAYLCSF